MAASWIPLSRHGMEIQPVHSGYVLFFPSMLASCSIVKIVETSEEFGK